MTILITGGKGFLGRHIRHALTARNCEAVCIGSEYDLRDEDCVQSLIDDTTPDVVFHLAALCGGIGANMERPGEFIMDNLRMGMNIIEHCSRRWGTGVRKLVLIGTICAYPQHLFAYEHGKPGPQGLEDRAIRESDLWRGYPEPTNAPYGIAKRTLVEISKAYQKQYGLCSINVMPANLYGPGDNFDPQTSHVIPAMIRRFVKAKEAGVESVTCWGTGEPTRDFLFIEDACEGIIRAAELLETPEPINLGTGQEISMRELAAMIAGAVGYEGRIGWDHEKPDGQPRRVLDIWRQRYELEFEPRTKLADGIRRTANWYENQKLLLQSRAVNA